MSQQAAHTVTISVPADKAAHLEKLSKISVASLAILSSKVDKAMANGKLQELENKLKNFQALI